jgi:hypothetical protein
LVDTGYIHIRNDRRNRPFQRRRPDGDVHEHFGVQIEIPS